MSKTVYFPKGSDASKALVSVEEISALPRIYVLTYLTNETPDNRLTRDFLTVLLGALEYVEDQWHDIVGSEEGSKGAALITTSVVEGKNAKIYSNGLDFEAAISDETFFDTCLNPVYDRLLSFPIPTIASVGGHAFAAGFGLAMAHDYRVMNEARGYLCMNEIDFGAPLPGGLHAALQSKINSPALMRKVVLEGHRFSAKEAHGYDMIDVLAQGPDGTLKAATELAHKFAVKAKMNAYASNKEVMYAPFVSIMRSKNSDIVGHMAAAKL